MRPKIKQAKIYFSFLRFSIAVFCMVSYLCYDGDVSFSWEPEGDLRVAIDQHQMKVVLVVRMVLDVDLER